MNPNKVIRPWLQTCGKQFGINEAFDYRWADASTRQQDMYFTYRIIRSVPAQDGTEKKNTKEVDNTTLNRITWKQFITTVQVDLHRSQNGMEELAACVIAAHDHPNIKKTMSENGCSFIGLSAIENLTADTDDELIEKYHHRMLVDLYDRVSIEFQESNEVVQTLNVTLGDWD